MFLDRPSRNITISLAVRKKRVPFNQPKGRDVVPKSLVKKTLRITAGVLFLLLGIIGGFLPIVQGWIFGLIGFYLLSYDIPIVRRQFRRLKARFPRHAAGLRRSESRMILRWRKIKAFFRRKPTNSPLPHNDPRASKDSKTDAAK